MAAELPTTVEREFKYAIVDPEALAAPRARAVRSAEITQRYAVRGERELRFRRTSTAAGDKYTMTYKEDMAGSGGASRIEIETGITAEQFAATAHLPELHKVRETLLGLPGQRETDKVTLDLYDGLALLEVEVASAGGHDVEHGGVPVTSLRAFRNAALCAPGGVARAVRRAAVLEHLIELGAKLGLSPPTGYKMVTVEDKPYEEDGFLSLVFGDDVLVHLNQYGKHLHDVDEEFSVLSGTVRATLGDDESVLRVGDTVRIPAEVIHALRADGAERVVLRGRRVCKMTLGMEEAQIHRTESGAFVV